MICFLLYYLKNGTMATTRDMQQLHVESESKRPRLMTPFFQEMKKDRIWFGETEVERLK